MAIPTFRYIIPKIQQPFNNNLRFHVSIKKPP